MQTRRKERAALRKQRLLAESSPSSASSEPEEQFDDDMSMRIRCSLPFSDDDVSCSAENNSTASSITEVSTASNKKISYSVDAIEKIGKVIPSDQAYNDILLLGGGGGEDKESSNRSKIIDDDIDHDCLSLTKVSKPVHKMLSSFRTTTKYQLLYKSEVIYALIATATAISYDESITSNITGQTCFCEIRGPILKVRLCNHNDNNNNCHKSSKVESYSIPLEVLVRKSALLAKQEQDETYYYGGRKEEKGQLRTRGGGGGGSVGPSMHHHRPNKGLASPRSIVSL